MYYLFLLVLFALCKTANLCSPLRLMMLLVSHVAEHYLIYFLYISSKLQQLATFKLSFHILCLQNYDPLMEHAY